MEEERICKHCQKPLKVDFQFCPYCGALNLEERPFSAEAEQETADENGNLDRLDVLEACLEVLDSEISQFLATK